MTIEYCDSCTHLNPTEDEQNIIKETTGRRPDHKCTLLGQRLLHMWYHPHIVSPSNCPLSKEQYKRGGEV